MCLSSSCFLENFRPTFSNCESPGVRYSRTDDDDGGSGGNDCGGDKGGVGVGSGDSGDDGGSKWCNWSGGS